MPRTLIDDQFVGREEELSALHDCFERAAGGRATLVAVSGEAGIGKSRLVHELRKRVEPRTDGIGVGHCLEHLRTPFLPFGEIFRGLGIDPGPDLYAVDDSPRGRAQTEKRLRRLQGLGHALLSATTKRPRIIVIEDVHWADAATLGLLEHLAISRTEDRVMVVVTVRSEAVERGGAFARVLSRLRSAGLITVRLTPLKPPQMTTLLRAASPSPLSRATIERIKERAEGNPLFAEELLRGAIDDGDGSLLHPAYASIRATVIDRLYQLREADQRVLVCAAAVGRFFDVRLVATLAERPLEQVLSALRRARNLQLIREVPGARAETLAFRHAVFSEVVYSELLEVEAREIHACVAEHLEHQPDARRRKAEIAYHWSASGNKEKALMCNIAAGDDAMALTAFEDAARFYEEALRYVEPGTLTAAELAEKRAYAWYAAGVAENTGALFSEALAAYEALGQEQKVVEMLLFLSRQAWNDAQTPDGYRHAMRAAELIGDQQASLRDYAQTMAASYATHLGQIDEAERIIAEYAGNEDPQLSARIVDVRAMLHARKGEIDEALRVCKGAQEIARRSGDADVIVRVFSNSADICAISRHRSEAAQLWHEAYVAAQAGGYIGRMAYAALGYAAALIDCGDLVRARELYNVAIETGVTNASVTIQVAAVGALLRAFIKVPTPAFIDEQAAVDLALRSQESLRIGQLGAALVFARLLEQRMEDARDLLDRTISALESPVFAEMLLILGCAHGCAATQQRARALLDGLPQRDDLEVAAICQKAAAALECPRSKGTASLQSLAENARELKYRTLELLLLLAADETVKVYDLAKSIGAEAYAQRLDALKKKRPSSISSVLTRREVEVARLIAEEESNRGIAERLGISERTVEHHVEAILSRLDVRSRWLVTPDLIARFS